MLSDPLVLKWNEKGCMKNIYELVDQNFKFNTKISVRSNPTFLNENCASRLLWIKDKLYTIVLYVNDNL